MCNFVPQFLFKNMPFKNQRNSREDNSKKQRSNSENFKQRPEQGRKNSNFRSDSKARPAFAKDGNPDGRPAFSKDRKDNRGSFGKPSFSRDKREDRNTADRPAFNRDRKDDRGSFGKSSFSRDKREDRNTADRPAFKSDRKDDRGASAFNKRSKFAKDGYSRNDKSNDKDFKRDRKPTSPEYTEQIENNDYKFSKGRKFSPARKPANRTANDDGLIRLNRYIANAGVCSRRKADELITAGVVSVNGEVVTELGTRVDPAKDEIRYNNERLKREKMVYVLLNKPKDYITTTDDPQERRTVMQLVAKATKERIYPVGRLDRNTTGLLLLTNDGNLADKLSHPKNGITKIYQVELNKNLTQGDFNKIEFGLELEDGLIKPDDLSYVQGASKREVGIQIHSGKNRIVRRIFESLGYEVIKLDRVVYANLSKKDLPRGRWRFLEERELIQLKHLIK